MTPPTSLSDLEKRLALLAKYGVLRYSDGLLSIDLSSAKRKPTNADPDDPGFAGAI